MRKSVRQRKPTKAPDSPTEQPKQSQRKKGAAKAAKAAGKPSNDTSFAVDHASWDDELSDFQEVAKWMGSAEGIAARIRETTCITDNCNQHRAGETDHCAEHKPQAKKKRKKAKKVPKKTLAQKKDVQVEMPADLMQQMVVLVLGRPSFQYTNEKLKSAVEERLLAKRYEAESCIDSFGQGIFVQCNAAYNTARKAEWSKCSEAHLHMMKTINTEFSS
jgi:hypothetical protein